MPDYSNDLKMRVERVIGELIDIFQLFEKDLGNPKRAASFDTAKEIETSIARLKRQGLPVPPELNDLKIKLFLEAEQNRDRMALYHKLQESIRGFIKIETPRKLKKPPIVEPNDGRSPHRKPPDYKNPLGSKGYSNLEDYLIPVIKLMWSGLDHHEAFRKIANKLDVRINTVSSQCTRALDLTTAEFVSQVSSRAIVTLLDRKYPDKYQIIKTQLK